MRVIILSIGIVFARGMFPELVQDKFIAFIILGVYAAFHDAWESNKR